MNFRNLFGKRKSEKEALKDDNGFINEEISEEISEEKEEDTENTNIVIKSEPRDFFWKNDGSDPKFIERCIKVWYAVMCFLWFIIGTITYAPILFISKKVDVVFKDKKKSLLIACAIYGIIIFALLFLFCFNRGEAVQQDI